MSDTNKPKATPVPEKKSPADGMTKSQRDADNKQQEKHDRLKERG